MLISSAGTMKLMAVLVFLYGIIGFGDAVGETFHWSSKSYTLKAVLTVPAANIREPYQVWLDGDTGKSRIDFYNGMDKLYREFDKVTQQYKYYKLHPETNIDNVSKVVCTEMNANASETRMYALNSYLPIKHWTYVGTEQINSIEAKKFVYEYPINMNQKGVGKRVYTVWIDIKKPAKTAIPLKFVYELKVGDVVLDNFGHDYTYYEDTKPDPSILEKPSNLECHRISFSHSHKPIDPLMEFIEPDLEHSRVQEAFKRFQKKHNKSYVNEEEHFKRTNIFKNNLRFINSLNRQHRSFSVGVNHLADLTIEEMGSLLGTRTRRNHDFESEGSGDYADDNNESAELMGVRARFDWRDYGAVTPVKDQTPMCGSCYAFTTAAAVESSAYVARGCKDLEEVSEQAIIDCTWGSNCASDDCIGNCGCSGGTYEYSLQWAEKNGLPLSSEYGGYLAMEGFCHAKSMKKRVLITNYTHVEKRKGTIKDTLRNNGPLMASLDANHLSFLFYRSGVYNEPYCSNDPMMRSHGVNIIGYGKEGAQEWWIIKNSFGQDWGENGFMRIDMSKNRCGLKNYVYSVAFRKNKSKLCKPLK